jgi:hypothetical protein
MSTGKINDRKLLGLIDDGLSQSETAKRLGVTRQAVSQRLREIRGRTTKLIVAKSSDLQPPGVVAPKVSQHLTAAIGHKIDTLEQLSKVNRHANEMLDLLIRWQSGDPEALRVLESQVKRVTAGEGKDAFEIIDVRMKDPRELALRCMAEIREQLGLQMKIFETLYSLKAAEEFQSEVLTAIGEVAPDVRQRIIAKLNERRAFRSVVRWS